MTISDIFEMVLDIWKSVLKVLLYFILLFTFPLWVLPYAIYNKANMESDFESMESDFERQRLGAITKEEAVYILEGFAYHHGSQLGRELWNKKTKDAQDKDIADFSRACRFLIEYAKGGAEE